MICKFCLQDAPMPVFPSPGHNLLENSDIRDQLVPAQYSELYALGKYSAGIKVLVNKLKFSKQAQAAEVLAVLFNNYVAQMLRIKQQLPDVLVPVPLSTQRLLKREYNQASLLTKHLSCIFDIPVANLLTKTKHTKQQSQLSREERLSNVTNVYCVNSYCAASRIAIVDDVVTTGATVNEACRAILQQLPQATVSVWCMGLRTLD